MKVEDEVDRLYGLPLEKFTEARNALAAELRKKGEREAADHLKTLPKPTISAWAVNQLARAERMQMRSLLTAGERLREAQAKLLRGGDREELQEAFERQRVVVGALVASAAEILRSGGHPATDATLERVRKTLTSATDDDGRRLIERGRLSEDLDPAGFGPLVPAKGAGPKRKSSSNAPRKREREAQAREQRIEAAQAAVEKARAERDERKAEARKAARSAEAARKAAEKAEEEAERADARLEKAKDALADARSS